VATFDSAVFYTPVATFGSAVFYTPVATFGSAVFYTPVVLSEAKDPGSAFAGYSEVVSAKTFHYCKLEH